MFGLIGDMIPLWRREAKVAAYNFFKKTFLAIFATSTLIPLAVHIIALISSERWFACQ
jgi:hypothetical protein